MFKNHLNSRIYYFHYSLLQWLLDHLNLLSFRFLSLLNLLSNFHFFYLYFFHRLIMYFTPILIDWPKQHVLSKILYECVHYRHQQQLNFHCLNVSLPSDLLFLLLYLILLESLPLSFKYLQSIFILVQCLLYYSLLSSRLFYHLLLILQRQIKATVFLDFLTRNVYIFLLKVQIYLPHYFCWQVCFKILPFHLIKSKDFNH